MKGYTEPELIKAGDPRVKLGLEGQPPLVDCRVFAEENYQKLKSVMNQLMEERNEAVGTINALFLYLEAEINTRKENGMHYSELLMIDVIDKLKQYGKENEAL